MVVAERENIAPGITQTLTAKLVPGNLRDHLRPAEQSPRHPSRDRFPGVGGGSGAPARDLVHRPAGGVSAQPGARRRRPGRGDPPVHRRGQGWRPRPGTAALSAGTPRLCADRGDCRPLRRSRHRHRWSGGLFRATGAGSRLQRLSPLEYALFGTGDPAGLAPAADALLADVTALQGRLAKLQPAPEQPLARHRHPACRFGPGAGAARDGSLRPCRRRRLRDGGNRHQREGRRAVPPFAEQGQPRADERVGERLAAVQATLAGYRRQESAYDKLDEAARTALATQIQDLADSVAKINPALGLE